MRFQEGSRIDSEPNFRNRKSANVKNQNFSSTESLQPSIFQTQPNRKEKRTVQLCSAVTFFQTVQSLEFESSSPPLECPYSMSLARPGFRRINKMLSFPFPFHIDKLYSYLSMSISFSFPLLSPTLSFPFLVLFLSNMRFRLPGKSILTNCIPYLPFSFSCPLLCFPFLPFLGIPFQYAFWKAWKKHIRKSHSFPWLFLFYSLSLLSLPFLTFLKIVTFLFFPFAFHFHFFSSCPVLSVVYSLVLSCLFVHCLSFLYPTANLYLTEPKRTVNRTESP